MKAGGPRGAGRAAATRGEDPAWRRQALTALADERFDVLIVGGGIVGVGALLDATSRGLRAALVEQRDIASGTSGRSSRLIHGGLRYLEQLHFGLVYEALSERARLLRLAPHLVRLEPFLFPIYGIPLLHQGFYGSGIFLYDLLGARRDGGFSEAPPAVERDRVRPEPPAQGPDRRDPLSRRGRGRRPSGARGAPDRARGRGGGGDARPRRGAAARRRADHRRERRGSRERE